mgnify:CR=1 FL=1
MGDEALAQASATVLQHDGDYLALLDRLTAGDLMNLAGLPDSPHPHATVIIAVAATLILLELPPVDTANNQTIEAYFGMYSEGVNTAALAACGSKRSGARGGTQLKLIKPIHAGKVIANLANNNDLDYRDISIEPSKHSHNNQQGLINVPINLLEKKIS